MEYYWTIFLFTAFFGSTHGDCGAPPRLQFGELNTQFIDQNNFSTNATVTYKCRPGYIRVPETSNSITCLSNSTWSTPDNFCTRDCGAPPRLQFGELNTQFIDQNNFSTNATVTYKCRPGYIRVPETSNSITCLSNSTWSTPDNFCTRDCGAPPRLQFGELNTQFIDQNNFSTNATVTYKCRPGYIRVPETSNSITCLSNSTWSTPDNFCTLRSCGNPGDIQHGSVSIINTLFGSRVNYTCDLGYNMISRRNFRECQDDGTWSNEVPICEVQTCPPPDAIVDGTFSPENEEYQYLNAVTYQCIDKRFALIGERTLSCTEHGNWSADPPKCKEVECSNPNVANAERVSGFSGPYLLNSAIQFRCLQGYTMVGSASVICNVSSEWEPALPTCSKIVTQRPTTVEKTTVNGGIVTQSPTTTKKETENGGLPTTQKPSTTKGKDENNGGSTVTQNATKQEKDETTGGGNNTGAIVGNALIIFIMSVMAFVMNSGF